MHICNHEKIQFFTCRCGHGIAPPTGIVNCIGTSQLSPLLKSTSAQVELIFFITVPEKQQNKIFKLFFFHPLLVIILKKNPIGCHTSLRSNMSMLYILHFHLAPVNCARAMETFVPKKNSTRLTILNKSLKRK